VLVNERKCNIICFQVTKREYFDHSYLRNFCTRKFTNFNYTPSIGSSGGIITIWNGGVFNGILVSQDTHHVTTEFTCNSSGKKWYLKNIYGPVHNEDRQNFITWLSNLDSTQMNLWIILGDFNLIRDLEDINRPRGVTSTHASVLVDSVGPPSAEVCRAAANFP
jgi:exonuclease III